jgi:hypothetical protein
MAATPSGLLASCWVIQLLSDASPFVVAGHKSENVNGEMDIQTNGGSKKTMGCDDVIIRPVDSGLSRGNFIAVQASCISSHDKSIGF